MIASIHGGTKHHWFEYEATVVAETLERMTDEGRVIPDLIPQRVLEWFPELIRTAADPANKKFLYVNNRRDQQAREHFIAHMTYFRSLGAEHVPKTAPCGFSARLAAYGNEDLSGQSHLWFRSVLGFCCRLNQPRKLTSHELVIAQEVLLFCQALRQHDDVDDRPRFPILI